MSANSGPGYRKNPEHRLAAKPAGVRVQVRLEEGSYPPVYYFPRKDVRMERLSRTDHHTYCPFKGTASYFSLKGGAENAVWTYETPYDEMLAIKALVAFYPDKVEISHG
jgi:uncharacterized protein (DUF427 family)